MSENPPSHAGLGVFFYEKRNLGKIRIYDVCLFTTRIITLWSGVINNLVENSNLIPVYKSQVILERRSPPQTWRSFNPVQPSHDAVVFYPFRDWSHCNNKLRNKPSRLVWEV